MQNTLEALSHLILKDYMVIFIRYVPLFSHFTDEYKLRSKETKKQHPQHHRAEERIQTWSSRLSKLTSRSLLASPKSHQRLFSCLGYFYYVLLVFLFSAGFKQEWGKSLEVQWVRIHLAMPGKVKAAQLCPTLWPRGRYSPWNSPAQNTVVMLGAQVQSLVGELRSHEPQLRPYAAK